MSDGTMIATESAKGTEIIRPSGLGMTTEQARTQAEIQSALTVAQARPRDERECIRRVALACERGGLARLAVYEYSRGGTAITGPSIHLLQAIAGYWGNIDSGWRELSRSNGVSSVQAYAWDLETNNRKSLTFDVPHKIATRQGFKQLTDPRDIYEWVANNAARRVRKCLEDVIPRDVIEDAVETCRATMAQSEPVTPETVRKLVAAFAEKGVTKEQLAAFFQRNLETISPAQMARLRRIYLSIQDGVASPEEFFPPLEADKPKPKTAKEVATEKAAETKRATLLPPDPADATGGHD